MTGISEKPKKMGTNDTFFTFYDNYSGEAAKSTDFSLKNA